MWTDIKGAKRNLLPVKILDFNLKKNVNRVEASKWLDFGRSFGIIDLDTFGECILFYLKLDSSSWLIYWKLALVLPCELYG